MFTEIVQIPTGVRLLLKLMLPLPAVAVTVPPQVLVTPGVAATCNPTGSVSVKLPLIATTFGLLMLKFTVVVPFTGIVARAKALGDRRRLQDHDADIGRSAAGSAEPCRGSQCK